MLPANNFIACWIFSDLAITKAGQKLLYLRYAAFKLSISPMEILGIIPARGKSKGISRKNIKPFLGRPLIYWTIKTALKSGVIDRLIVSTDDKEIAAIAQKYGAEVPFLRPARLAQDLTPTLPVLRHAVSYLKTKEDYWPDYVILLEATSPGREPRHVREALDMLVKSGSSSLVSIMESPAHHNPHWKLKMKKNGRLKLFTGGSLKKVIRSRHKLPKVYMRNGLFHIFKPELLFAREPGFYGEDTVGYLMDSKYFSDIDTEEDWVGAEKKFKKYRKILKA